MSTPVSTNYREIDPIEAVILAADYADAWKDPGIPQRQYDTAVKAELEGYRVGKPCAPFDALIRCLRKVNFGPSVSLLDVGASAGYYGEVLKIAGYDFEYTALDSSPAFKELAERLYPGIRFDVADARYLPYTHNAFNIVLSGCCMLHVLDYENVIQETARVCSKYAIFSKTPIRKGLPTAYYEKEGYGQRMLEIHFGEDELLGLFTKYGLEIVAQEDVYQQERDPIHRTYLLRKKSLGERQWESA